MLAYRVARLRCAPLTCTTQKQVNNGFLYFGIKRDPEGLTYKKNKDTHSGGAASGSRSTTDAGRSSSSASSSVDSGSGNGNSNSTTGVITEDQLWQVG